MQRDHALHGGSERLRNLRVAHVGEVLLALHLEIMDLRVESVADLSGGAGEIDHHPVGIDVSDGEVVRFEPFGNDVDIFLRKAVFFSLFGGRHPVAEVGRALNGKGLDVLVELKLQLGRALQLKQHVLERKLVGYAAKVVFRVGFKARVADEGDEPGFVHRLGDHTSLIARRPERERT